MMRISTIFVAALVLGTNAAAAAQQPMGSLPLADARVSGALEIDGARATLISNVELTAYGHTATVSLARGGSVQVCATSAFHLLHSGSADGLLFALDHGAAEIRTQTRAQDTILTPDLRFNVLAAGALDLRVRVSPEGDTCVDNHGNAAPTLGLTEAFGSANYHLTPGQHVLFEHGSLRAVVDNEASDCGCPPATPAMTAAGTRNATSVPNAQQAAAEHPFPAAESAGLVATAPPLDAAAAQSKPSTATLRLNNGADPAAVPPPATQAETPAAATVSTPAATAVPPPAPPGAHAIGHSVGNFFRRLFGRKPKQP